MNTLRWMQPAGSAFVDYWNVYKDGELHLWGVLVEPDAAGVYETTIPASPAASDYTMTAVNAGGESPPSNIITLPEPGMVVGLVVCLVVLGMFRRKTLR